MIAKIGLNSRFKGFPQFSGNPLNSYKIADYLKLKNRIVKLTGEGTAFFQFFFPGVEVPEKLIIKSVVVHGIDDDRKVPVVTVRALRSAGGKQEEYGCLRTILFKDNFELIEK